MPSCLGQDLQLYSLMSSVAVPQPTATGHGPSKPCDPDWCRIADLDGGKRCPPGQCAHTGTLKPKAKCEGESELPTVAQAQLWGRAAGRPRATPAADKKAAALAKARARTVRDLRAALERVAKALRAGRKARALEPGEAEMLRLVEGWMKLLASEAKPRRPR